MNGKNQSICSSYDNGKYLALALSQSISQIIVAVNFVLRIFIIKAVMYIGLDTESGQTQRITNGVFVVQFFNTALLLLLCSSNLKE